jgi:4-amino-4-deoxy-L-arabinose transferase-like glycosyltransferase
MFRICNNRPGHYGLLLTLMAGLCLPNLGVPSLWDIDEGNNAEAAREMLESDNWVVPTFNYELRVDKPALLYWLQIGAYQVFGVNEFAARLPSAVAALATILLVYELGRRLFSATTGLLAGVILASSIAFCASAHFANPDALLNGFAVLTFLIFWSSFVRGGRGWFVLTGLSTGLGVLAKGPVGLVLPLGVIVLFLMVSRKLHLLLDRRVVLGVLIFALVALPWYAWVAVDTKGAFLRGFIEKHNLNRFLSPMENHRGPVYYYLAVLILGFAPWSAFLGLAGWFAWGKRAQQDSALVTGYRFLGCWIAIYLVFFSLAATKLPNYILPIYAPLALLTARFLERWCRRLIQPPGWALNVSLACVGLMGVGTTFAVLAAAGWIDLPKLRERLLPGLAPWAFLGPLLLVGATAAWWCQRRQQPVGSAVSVAATALFFTGALAAAGILALDRHKAPRPLVQISGARQTETEVRVGCYQYFQPSLVFYCRREVHQLFSDDKALEFLRCPLPAYLFVPAEVWANLEKRAAFPTYLLGRHYDLYRHCEVVVVGNGRLFSDCGHATVPRPSRSRS